MKYSKFSLVGIGAGIIFVLGTFNRYWVLHPDLDKCLAYGLIGILVSCVSFLYGRTLIISSELNTKLDKLSLEIDAIEERLNDMWEKEREVQEK